MDADVAERFRETDEYIHQMDERLRSIARQNAALAEMVEVLGSFVHATTDMLQQHVREQHDY